MSVILEEAGCQGQGKASSFKFFGCILLHACSWNILPHENFKCIVLQNQGCSKKKT